MGFLKKYWVYLLVFGVAVAQYSNTSEHGYAWDDVIVLTENTRVTKGLSNIPELFENIASQRTEHIYGYRPIALLSFAADVELFGMHPPAAHKTNIILYGLLCILILYFLQKIFPTHPWRNLTIALLFVVHPLHTEVVANIKSRDEILAMIFGLIGLLLYDRANNSRPLQYYMLSCLAIILAFLSKESAITFCGVACLIPWMASSVSGVRNKILRCIPASMIILVLLGIRAYVYSDAFYQFDYQALMAKGIFIREGFIGNPLLEVKDMVDLSANIIHLEFLYILKFIYPYPLLHDYSFDQLHVLSWGDSIVWVSLFASIALFITGIYGLIRRKMYGFGIIFFFITISIYLHVVRLAPDIFAERFMFVPSLGLTIAVVASTFQIGKLSAASRYSFFGVVCLIFFSLSWQRNYAWKDSGTLFTTDLPRLENCVRANYNYAMMLHGKYYKTPEHEKPRMQRDILKHYERAMGLRDRTFNVHMDLGSAYMEFGYWEKGKRIFEKVIQNYPELSFPHAQMAKYYMSFNDFGPAIGHLETAIRLGRANSDFYYLMAICRSNSGFPEDAISVLLTGEKYGTGSSAYYELMARIFLGDSKDEEARKAIRKGLSKYPDDAKLILLRNSLLKDRVTPLGRTASD